MKLAKQNIEVWIDDGSKPYGFPGYYCCKCIIDGGKPVNMMIEFDGNNWGEADTKRIGYDTFDILGWQGSVKDVYVLTEDEIKELLSEAFDEGAVWEYEKHFRKEPLSKSKNTFIKSII